MSCRITLVFVGAVLLGFAEVVPTIVRAFDAPVGAAATDQFGAAAAFELARIDSPVDTVAVRGLRAIRDDRRTSYIRASLRGQNCRLGPTGLAGEPFYPNGVTSRDPRSFALGPGEGDDPVLLSAPGGPSNAPFRLFSLGDRPAPLAEWPGPSEPIPGGPSIAIGNLFGDATNEVVIGRLKVIDVVAPRPTDRFFFSYTPFPDYDGPVRVSIADIIGKDGRSEIIATKGDGGEVSIVSVSDERLPFEVAYGAPMGTEVQGLWSAGVDLTGDGFAEILLAAGSGAGLVGVFDASRGGILIGRINAFPDSTTGARVDGGFIEGRPVVIAGSEGQFRAFGASLTTDEWVHLDNFAPNPPFGREIREDVFFDIWTLDRLPRLPQSIGMRLRTGAGMRP
jgi:hypothetical protein